MSWSSVVGAGCGFPQLAGCMSSPLPPVLTIAGHSIAFWEAYHQAILSLSKHHSVLLQ